MDKDHSFNIDLGVPEQHLTAQGREQGLSIGRDFRQRFVNSGLLPPKYLTSAIYTRSSFTDRTQNMAELILAGMYPDMAEVPRQTYDLSNGLYTSLPKDSESFILVTKSQDDYLLKAFSGQVCPTSMELQDSMMAHINKKYDGSLTHFFSVMKSVGVPEENLNLRDIESYVDALWCYHAEYNQYPWLFDNQTETEIKQTLLALNTEGMFGREEAVQLNNNELFNTISNAFKAKSIGFPMKIDGFMGNWNVALFTAHDYNIITVLKALGQEITDVIPFASQIEFELLQEGNETFTVITRFNGVPLDLTKQGLSCNENFACTLESYQRLLAANTFDELTSTEEKCTEVIRPSVIDMTSWVLFGIIACVIIGIVVLLVLSCLYLKNLKKETDPTERFRFMKETVRSDQVQ